MARYTLRKLLGVRNQLVSLRRMRPICRLRVQTLEDRVTPSVTDLTTHLSYPTIQAAVNAANTGDTLLADPGTYNEHVTINKSLTLEGAQHGVDARARSGSESIVNGGGFSPFYVTANDVTIDGFTIEGADGSLGNVFPGGFGIELAPGTAGAHVVNNIVENNIVGMALTNASTTDQAVVQHDLFENNTLGGSAGGTDIYADQFTAGSGGVNDTLINANTFTNSSFVGDAWALGISNTGTTPFSGITFSNNTVTNHGRGVYFFNTANSSVSGNVITGASHYAIGIFGSNGTPASSAISITNNALNENGSGGAAIEVVDDTNPGTAYSGTLTLSGDQITTSGSDRSIDNESTAPINATGEIFNGTAAASATTAQLYAVEDRIIDGIDVSGFGLVRLKANNVYVTPNSFYALDGTTSPSIQRGVNAASVNDTINVEAGTYTGLVTVGKTVTLLGAQHGVDARTRNVPASQETILNNAEGDFQIEADSVTIDGFTLEGVTADPNSDPAALGAAIWTNPGFSGTHGGTQIVNNIIEGNIAGIELDNDGTLQTKVQHNLFENNNQPGPNSGLDIEVDFSLANALIDANAFTNSSFVENSWAFGVEAPGSNITFSNNTVNNHGRGLFLYETSGAAITGNTINGATHYGVGLFGGDSNIQVLENDLSNDARGLDIEDQLGGSPNSNIIANMCNSFANDTVFGVGIVNDGVGNGYTGTLDVSMNWWGNGSGPIVASNPTGTGAKIQNDFNDPINYAPWATSAACNTFTAGPGLVVIGSQLYIGGANTNDQVQIDPIGSSKTGSTGIRVQAKLNGVNFNVNYNQAFTAINIFLQDGNDSVKVATPITIATNVIDGNGNDNIQLGSGNNTVTVGNGNDQVQAGDGNNAVTVGNGNDNVQLGDGNNTVTAGTGNINIQLGDGTNSVTAGAAGSKGNIQTKIGNGSNNTVSLFGNGNDQVQTGDGNFNSISITGNGNENVQVGKGNFAAVNVLGNGKVQVNLGDGNNDLVSITGNGDNNVQIGKGNFAAVSITGSGNDNVQVGNGNSDIVTVTGDGNDQVKLGDGNNDSVFVTSNGNDQIQIGNGMNGFVSLIGAGNDSVQTGNGSGHVHVAGTGHKNLHLGNGWSQI